MRKMILLVILIFLVLPVTLYAFDMDDFDDEDAGKLNTVKKSPLSPGASQIKSAVSATQSEDDEIAFGKQLAGTLLGAAPLVKNQILQEYVNKVGLWIAMQSERPNLPWKFAVIDSDSINAFATPGGYIVVTKGLYLTLGSEQELAAVLAHEVAHVVKKHYWNIVNKQKLVAGLVAIGSSKLADSNNPELMKKLINTGAELLARGLDKGAEFEADIIAVILVRRAGYESNGLYNVLDRLAMKPSKDASLLFATHPSPTDRINGLSESLLSISDSLEGGKTYKLSIVLK